MCDVVNEEFIALYNLHT